LGGGEDGEWGWGFLLGSTCVAPVITGVNGEGEHGGKIGMTASGGRCTCLDVARGEACLKSARGGVPCWRERGGVAAWGRGHHVWGRGVG